MTDNKHDKSQNDNYKADKLINIEVEDDSTVFEPIKGAEQANEKKDFDVMGPLKDWYGNNKRTALISAGGLGAALIVALGFTFFSSGSDTGVAAKNEPQPVAMHPEDNDQNVMSGAYNIKGVVPANKVAKSHTESFLSQQLEELSSQLSSINDKLSQNVVVDIDPIKQQIAQLSQQANQLTDQSNQYITAAIREQTSVLTHKMDGMQKQLDEMNPKNPQNQQLSVNDLPFEIVAIDNIQGNNIVTVRYDYQTTPLNKGDRFAGWKLVEVNFNNQLAQFMNNKHQYVNVDLNQVAS
jgi:hypothetical protein